MDKSFRSLTDLTNEQLLEEVKLLAGREHEATARLIASLAELDARRLYLGEGFSSLFTYCTQCLHLSRNTRRTGGSRQHARHASGRWFSKCSPTVHSR